MSTTVLRACKSQHKTTHHSSRVHPLRRLWTQERVAGQRGSQTGTRVLAGGI
jgi:hypothetical protein